MKVIYIVFAAIILIILALLTCTPIPDLINSYAIFHPEKPDIETYKNVLSEYEKNIEHIDVVTEDGHKLDTIFFNKNRNPSWDDTIIIYFHGNAGWIGNSIRSEKIKFLSNYGSVILFDYRGYGISTGIPNEKGMYIDANAIWKTITQKCKPENIILYGHSLGSSIASHLVKELCEKLEELPRGLLLEAPFSTIEKIAIDIHPLLAHVSTTKFNNLYNIEKIHKCKNEFPIVIFHSNDDDIIPFSHSEHIVSQTDAILINIDGTHNIPIYTEKSIKTIENLCSKT